MQLPEVPIVTERLVLRPWEDDDADALTEAITASLEHLRPWMAWIAEEPLGRAGRLDLIDRFRHERDTGQSLGLGIFLHDGTVVGGTGLHARIGPGGLEIGYWVHVDHVGRGIATEAAGALTDAGLALEEVDRIEIHHDVENRASGRVPAKLGFTRVERIRVEPVAPAETGFRWVWAKRRTAPTFSRGRR
jgi:ribosomal-protein-serine acetyltransferase